MLEYDRIDISKGIDIKKTNASKEYKTCHYCTLKISVLSMNHILCNGCKVISFNNVAIFYVKGIAYKIHFWYMSIDDAINIMNNSSLIDKMGVL